MYHKKSEKGQALVIIALAAVGLFAFTALAIDGSRVFSDRRHAQNAADTAVLAAALAKIRTPDYPPNAPDAPVVAAVDAGLHRAATNGYTNDADSTVEVRFCDEVLSLDLKPPCEGVPDTADRSEYIQVVIQLTTKTTFARIIGRREVPSMVTAIARAKPGTDTPLFNGAALAALQTSGSDTIKGNGNVQLDIHNSGIFNNSSDNCALNVVGTGSYTVDTAFDVVSGTYCYSGNPNQLQGGPVQLTGQVAYPPIYNIPTPSIDCGTQVSVYDGITHTFSPGNHANLIIPNGTHTFAPGNHCFSGGVSIGGNTNIIANDVNFVLTSGEFVSNAVGSFTCNNMLFHINGGTGFTVNGVSTNNCTNVTFFASTGNVYWGGNPVINFTAPSSGPYAHVLIYMPFGNTSPLTINGNSANHLTGSIIAVSSAVQINGNSGTFALSSQITGLTVGIGGNGQVDINFNPAEQYSQTEPTAIQLIE